jgi:hypothetical protein
MALVGAVFLLSRLLLLYGQLALFPGSGEEDIRLYAGYAEACDLAWSQGGSVYDHCQAEYPHLALAVMALPRVWMKAAPPILGGGPPGLARYRALYRVEMALFDLLAFLALLWLVNRLYRAEPVRQRAERLLAFVVVGLLLGTFLYNRLDIVQGALVVLSLALLVSRLHYAWSFAVLALAINFKLVPVVLVPVWVLASLPPGLVADARNQGGVRRLVGVCCWRLAVATALTLALFAPVYLSSGERCLAFFQYHRDRGLEVGSFYSAVILGLKPFGYPSACYYGHGCINVDSPASALLTRLSPAITLGLLLAVTLFSGWLLLRRKAEDEEGRAPGLPAGGARSTLEKGAPPAGRLFGGDLAACASLALLVFIAGNKVFSPQYLLWLLPLLPLLPFSVVPRRLCLGSFGVVCAISTATRLLWARHIVVSPWVEPVTWVSGPTALGSVLLISRNVVFLALILLVGTCLVRGIWARPGKEGRLPLGRRDKGGLQVPAPSERPLVCPEEVHAGL